MMTARKRFAVCSFATITALFACLAATGEPQNQASGLERGSAYFPLSVGSWWRYRLQGQSNLKYTTIKWSVTQKENVRGTVVFHLWQTPPEGDEPLSLSEVQGGLIEAGTDRIVLKNPLHAGDRWVAKSQSLRAKGSLDSFEVTSAGKPCSIGGRSFQDCASIRESDEGNNISSITTYVRGIGPVQYVYFKGLHSDDVSTMLTIKDWSLAGVKRGSVVKGKS